jgi:trehalose 6-phosphate phosphatase
VPQFADFRTAYHDDPTAALLAFDFDGTLAPIVPTPRQAQLDPSLTTPLQALGEQSNVVVISGRPSEFLRSRLAGIKATLIGNYGRPETIDSQNLAMRDELARRATRELPTAVLVEVKPSSIALHYRRAPELASVVTAWARAVTEANITHEFGKSVVELVIGDSSSKDVVLRRLSGTYQAVLYAGDDQGDVAPLKLLPTLNALTCGLVILSDQTPPDLLDVADEQITRQQFREYLRSLAGR